MRVVVLRMIAFVWITAGWVMALAVMHLFGWTDPESLDRWLGGMCMLLIVFWVGKIHKVEPSEPKTDQPPNEVKW